MIPLFDRAALKRDLPEHQLCKGDVGTVVDRVPHPHGGEPGILLEIFNALGDSIRTVAVRESDIAPLHADEVLAVRTVTTTG